MQGPIEWRNPDSRPTEHGMQGEWLEANGFGGWTSGTMHQLAAILHGSAEAECTVAGVYARNSR